MIRYQTALAAANGIQLTSWQALKAGIASTIKVMAKWMITNPAGWAIMAGTAIVGLVAAYDALTISVKEAKENLSELTSEVERFRDEIKNIGHTADKTGKRFAELAQKVDQFTGKNKKLSTEEYEEFLDLSNQLADTLDILPRIYDDSGNAIVQLSGDVDTIVGSLQNLVDVERDLANQKIAANLPDIFKNTKVVGQGIEGELQELEGYYDYYEEIIKALGSISHIDDIYDENGFAKAGYENLAYDLSHNWDMIDKLGVTSDVNDLLGYYQYKFNEVANSLDVQEIAKSSNWSNFTNSLVSWLSTQPDYSIFSDNLQSGIQRVINTIDWGNFGTSEEAQYYIIDNLISPIKHNPEVKKQFEALFSESLNELSIKDAKFAIDKYIGTIANLLDKDPLELKVALGFDNVDQLYKNLHTINTDAIAKFNKINPAGVEYDGYARYEKSRADEFAEDFSINTQDELAMWWDCIEAAGTLNEAMDMYKDKLAQLRASDDGKTIGDLENELALIEARKSQLESFIDMTETAGKQVSTDLYDKLIEEEKNIQDNLIHQREIYLNKLNSGTVIEGSDEWYELMNAINDVTLDIEKSGIQVYKYQNLINDLEWGNFDELREKITEITGETEFLIDLLSNSKLFDEKGGYTNEGLATLSQHAISREIHLDNAEEYAQEIKDLDEQYKNNKGDKHYIERKRELVDAYRDSIQAAQDEKNAMIELAQEGIEKQIEYTQELIDKKKEALEIEKDLYEYQKSVTEKTDNIANLQKQLSVYQYDDSEEGRKKVQQLQKEMKDAENDLDDFQYDKWMQDQNDMLDNLMEEYEELQEKRFEDTERLFETVREDVSKNADTISATILGVASLFGVTLSDEMQDLVKTLPQFSELDFGTNFAGTTNAVGHVLSDLKIEFSLLRGSADVLAENILKVIGDGVDSDGEKYTELPSGYILKNHWTDSMLGLFKDGLLPSAIFSTNNISNLASTLGKILSPATMNYQTEINLGNIELPNVTNAEEFVNQLSLALKKNSKIQNIIRGFTVDLTTGKPTLGMLRH